MTTGFNLVQTQDNIVAHLAELIPNTKIFEDSIPDDADIPTDPLTGKAVPYVVVRFGPLRPSYTGKSMAGPRYDEYWATFDLMAICPTGRQARVLNNGLVDAFIGWSPIPGGPQISMRTDAGDPAQFVVTSHEARPTQYISSTRLRYVANADAVGSGFPDSI